MRVTCNESENILHQKGMKTHKNILSLEQTSTQTFIRNCTFIVVTYFTCKHFQKLIKKYDSIYERIRLRVRKILGMFELNFYYHHLIMISISITIKITFLYQAPFFAHPQPQNPPLRPESESHSTQ